MGRCSRLLPESPSGGETRLSPDAPTNKRSRSTWWTDRSFRCPSVASKRYASFHTENHPRHKSFIMQVFPVLSSWCESSCWPSDPLQPTSPIVIGTGAQKNIRKPERIYVYPFSPTHAAIPSWSTAAEKYANPATANLIGVKQVEKIYKSW